MRGLDFNTDSLNGTSMRTVTGFLNIAWCASFILIKKTKSTPIERRT